MLSSFSDMVPGEPGFDAYFKAVVNHAQSIVLRVPLYFGVENYKNSLQDYCIFCLVLLVYCCCLSFPLNENQVHSLSVWQCGTTLR